MKQKLVRGLTAGMLAVMVLGSGPLAQAQERIPENTILVQGIGAVTARPDAMQLNAGVETDGATAEAARNANAQRMTAVINRIKALNIPGLVIQTSGYNVYPLREVPPPPEPGYPRPLPYPRKPGEITGYRATNNVNIKVEGADPNKLADYASRILDTAVDAGANVASGVNFYMSRNNKAQDDALKLAIQQARHNAEMVAQASGVRLSGVYNIETYGQSMPMRAMGSAMEGVMMKDAAPTPVESGEFEVTATVTVRYDFQD